MIAHIRKNDKALQTLKEHSENVAVLCERSAEPLGLSKTAFFLGLLHDMGKATKEFEKYLLDSRDENSVSSPHHHSPTGAIFVFRRYFSDENADQFQRAAAQILALCILGHHAGLSDCLSENARSDFLDSIKKEEKNVHYDEATEWFFKNIKSEAEIDSLFEEAKNEIKVFISEKIGKNADETGCFFRLGMLTRLLLGILVDADRWDSACFEYNVSSTIQTPSPNWENLFERFEDFRKSELNACDEIGKIRSEISDECFSKAADKPGIYTLCVPTGGGKTYSSLRFALKHAAFHKKQRIFYIIPFNTILDQNAQDIRKALRNYPSILEHHSNVIMPTEKEQDDYRRLTERWDSDIILTSLVQFMNACFSAPNTDARRLGRLTNAVLIFDEIQSLPKHCKTLFEQAIAFLCSCCGSTAILCTATQPKLDLTPKPENIIKNCENLFSKMKRVTYNCQFKKPLHNDEAAAKLAELLKEQSVLTIVNTKAVASDIYHEVVLRLPENGLKAVSAELGFTDEEIVKRAKESADNEVLCVHMSTLLCPAHRKKLIKWVKLWLKERVRVFCSSTALIEAGINVSFPLVVRSLTGLPSVVQAAGRANRSMEYDVGNVFIWELCDENLQYLNDISNGRDITRSMLFSENPSDPDSPEQIELYFSREQDYTNEYKDYPRGKNKPSLFSLLSDNITSQINAYSFKEDVSLVLKQSFRTAYREFEMIPQNTKTVVVPFEKGKEIIGRLESETSLPELRFLLRAAQAYSVSLPESTFNRLNAGETQAIFLAGDTGVYCLKDGYYDSNGGVSTERGELELMLF